MCDNSIYPTGTGGNGCRPKVLLIGATGVGKTSVLLRYTGHGFNSTQTPTIGAGFSVCSVPLARPSCSAEPPAAAPSTGGSEVELGVWDTAGQERYRAMMPLYYRNAAAAVVVYDVTSRQTLDCAKVAHSDLMRYAPPDVALCVVGNKIDMAHSREVSPADGEEFAAGISADFCETSALSGLNVDKAFYMIARQLMAAASSKESKAATGGHMMLSARHDGVAHAFRRKKLCCAWR